ncbi:MAG: hypothetical protein AAGC79_04810 [Pseudomonadota bacterium]
MRIDLKRFGGVMALIAIAFCSTQASAVTLAIAEDSRAPGGVATTIAGAMVVVDATDEQFRQASPDDLNAAFASAGAFTGPFGAEEVIQVFGGLAGGEDPILVTFTSPFRVTLDGSRQTSGSNLAQGRIEIRAGGTGGDLVSQLLYSAGDGDREVFDSSTLSISTGLFEIRTIGRGINTNGQTLAYDLTIAGFTEIPLPASLPLLLGGLGMMWAGARKLRR